MKLSEMTGEQLINCICLIAEPAERIAKDPAFFDMLFSCMKVTDNRLTINKVRVSLNLLPFLMKNHRDDTLAVAGAMNGQRVDEMLAQNGFATLRDLKNCFDADLLSFFGLSGSAE